MCLRLVQCGSFKKYKSKTVLSNLNSTTGRYICYIVVNSVKQRFLLQYYFDCLHLPMLLYDSFLYTGVTYVRWGRSTCPNVTGTQLVYSGRAGGTFWNIQGGGAEKLCLPDQPEYLPNTANQSIQYYSYVHGAEYEYRAPNSNIFQHNVPCAVCSASARSSTLMIPAKIQCPPTWTREYYGYLSSERENHYRSSFSCVDVNPEVIENSSSNGNGALFYYVLSACCKVC